MTDERRHNVTVAVVVRCGFIGCDWSIEIGTAPLEAHNAYLDHLDVHDVEVVDLRKPDDCDQEASPSATYTCPRCQRVSHNPNDAREQYCGACNLYEGDSAWEIAAAQARVDRFMAGGEDQ